MKKRSLNQNDFYRGPFLKALSAGLNKKGVNWTEKECHAALKLIIPADLEESDYLPNAPRVTKLPSGRLVERPFSTTWLSVSGMENYLQAIRAFAITECGRLELPLPNEGLTYPSTMEGYHG